MQLRKQVDLAMEQQNLSPREDDAAVAQDPQKGVVKSCYEWMEAIIPALILIMVFFTFVIRSITVSGPSMEPTLMDQYKVWVSCVGYTPQAGDIVVVDGSGTQLDEVIVKRIIATGGDTIDIDPVTGDVLVNGEVLDEPYIAEKINTLEKMGDMTYPQTVPEGCVFVMGDNRNYSTDSRWSQLGMVDERYILGHVLSVVYPFSEFGSVA